MSGTSDDDARGGPDWRAYWAIVEGDEPVECLAEYLAFAAERLSLVPLETLSQDHAEFLAGLTMVLTALDEAANGGDTYYALHLSRRPGLRPNKMERARRLDKALHVYRGLRSEGWKVDAAASEVQRLTGVPRSTLLKWKRDTDRQRETLRRFLAERSKK